MEKQGIELEFINKIKRDGTELLPIESGCSEFYRNCMFQLQRLSITEDTYIASNCFSTFIVKLK